MSQDGGELGRFDRFATAVADLTARAWFFALCVLTVVVWAPSIVLFQDINTWQLLINSTTTIVTYLLVALLQNTQRRSDQAIQIKLNAIAEGLADLMDAHARDDPDMTRDVQELRDAVGLEQRQGSSPPAN